MDAPASSTPIRTTLVDVSNCIGCRACQVACKQWNERDGESTELQPDLGLPEPRRPERRHVHPDLLPGVRGREGSGWRSATPSRCSGAFTASSRPASPPAPPPRWYASRTGRSPTARTSASAAGTACWPVPGTCPPRSGIRRLRRSRSAPTARTGRPSPLPKARNGFPLTVLETQTFKETTPVPACVKACPADALRYGEREEMLAEGRRRIAAPAGEIRGPDLRREGGRRDERALPLPGALRRSSGSPSRGRSPTRRFSKAALTAVPPAVMALGATLAMAYAVFRKRVQAVAGAGARRGPPRGVRAAPAKAADPDQLAAPPVDGGLRGGDGRALRSRPRGQHAPLGHLPLGALDRLRPGVDRGGGRRVRDGGGDLHLPAEGPVPAGPHCGADGPAELLVRDGHPGRRPRAPLALLPARASSAPEHSAMFEVSWCVGALRHHPPPRIPPGARSSTSASPGPRRSGGAGRARTSQGR